jgi:hypothetical protein
MHYQKEVSLDNAFALIEGHPRHLNPAVNYRSGVILLWRVMGARREMIPRLTRRPPAKAPYCAILL